MENNLNSGLNPTVTIGNYGDEISSGKDFDYYCEKTGLFKIYGKDSVAGIHGEMIHPLPGMDNKSYYLIDRILSPTDKLVSAGWNLGLIGVELKKTGIKVGPPLSQMLDYLRCAWIIPKTNIKALIDYCFLWPLDKCGGCTASIMAQNRIGGCCVKNNPDAEWFRMQFSIGEVFVIKHYFNSDTTEISNMKTGSRTGSR
jgi:hypothetical protein